MEGGPSEGGKRICAMMLYILSIAKKTKAYNNMYTGKNTLRTCGPEGAPLEKRTSLERGTRGYFCKLATFRGSINVALQKEPIV